MRSIVLSIVIASSILTVCACSTSVSVRPTLQANLIAPCPPIPTLPPEASMQDLMQSQWDLVSAYGTCSARHRALVEGISK